MMVAMLGHRVIPKVYDTSSFCRRF
jgi:hypothetical protein